MGAHCLQEHRGNYAVEWGAKLGQRDTGERLTREVLTLTENDMAMG